MGLAALVAAFSWQGIIMWAVLCLMAYLFRRYITGIIGGVTGDVMGAASELSEIWFLWLVLILARYAGLTVLPW